jgi:hypothetical protein
MFNNEIFRDLILIIWKLSAEKILEILVTKTHQWFNERYSAVKYYTLKTEEDIFR